MLSAFFTKTFCQDKCSDNSGSSTTKIPEEVSFTPNIKLAKKTNICRSPEDRY